MMRKKSDDAPQPIKIGRNPAEWGIVNSSYEGPFPNRNNPPVKKENNGERRFAVPLLGQTVSRKEFEVYWDAQREGADPVKAVEKLRADTEENISIENTEHRVKGLGGFVAGRAVAEPKMA